MQQVVIGTEYGTHNLATQDVDTPIPKAGEVLIKMKAASLNYRDWEVVNGQYHENFPTGMVPLSDGAGEVIKVGNQVTSFAPGDRVISSFWQGWQSGELKDSPAAKSLGGPLGGCLSEYQVIAASGLVKMPASMTFVQAATLPCAAVTAWQALITKGNIKSGDWVLVQGTGGVSMFAQQLALMHGARVITLSSSDTKLDTAKQNGALHTINYQTTPEWAVDVNRLTHGQGVDHIVEVGGPNTLSQSLACIAPGGQINVVGYLGGKDGSINPLQILQAHATVRGIAVGPTSSLQALCNAIDANGLEPLIDREFQWQDYRQAFDYLASGNHLGKIVLTF
ncbi:zinc-dependent alcohol dehydrogenase family protein [Alteromonas lipotrueiana]|uniref:zinc-dependent alcohol dehydrogenase family protein n=1 Tax=Alteromonas lipotrueiana TaxID=2803815 RepID=UPI001C4880FE|nr:NAD(P)-dependent alcohol dehydrogenase [Alteromonas lipotrueiana]